MSTPNLKEVYKILPGGVVSVKTNLSSSDYINCIAELVRESHSLKNEKQASTSSMNEELANEVAKLHVELNECKKGNEQYAKENIGLKMELDKIQIERESNMDRLTKIVAERNELKIKYELERDRFDDLVEKVLNNRR